MRKFVHSGLLLAGLVVCLSTGCVVPQPPGKGKLTLLREKTTKREYWLYLPEEYMAQASKKVSRPVHPATQNKLWPLVVSFHGMKPFDNCLPQAQEWQQEADRYGFIMIAPQLMTSDLLMEFPLNHVHGYVQTDEQCSLAIMREVTTNLPADPQQVLSTSWSSGGYMAHYMMNRHSSLFSCLAVRQSNFSEGILDQRLIGQYRDKPIAVFWTQNDFAICQSESRKAVEWYRRHGFKNLSWGVFANMGHERTPQSAAAFFAMQMAIAPKTPARFERLVEAYGLTQKAVAYGLRASPRSASDIARMASEQPTSPQGDAPLRTAAAPVRTPAEGTQRTPVRRSAVEPAFSGNATDSGVAPKSRMRNDETPIASPSGRNERTVPSTKEPDWSGQPSNTNARGQGTKDTSRGSWVSPPQGGSAKPFAPRTNATGGQQANVVATPVRPPANEEVTPTRVLSQPQRTPAEQKPPVVAPKRTSLAAAESPPPVIPPSPAKASTVQERPIEDSVGPAPPRIINPQRGKNEVPVRTVARNDETPAAEQAVSTDAEMMRPSSVSPANTGTTGSATPRAPRRTRAQSGTVEVTVSRSFGVSPCYVSFKAILPAQEAEKADFLWTDNGTPVCSGQNGYMVLSEAGEHRIEVLVITANDRELRGGQTVVVMEKSKGAKRPTHQYGSYP